MSIWQRKLPMIDRILSTLEQDLEQARSAPAADIVKMFEACTMLKGDLMESGNTPGLEEGKHEAINRLERQLGRIVRLVEDLGPEATSLLLSLLEHTNNWVRLSTAVYGLRIAPSKAKPVLEELSKIGGFIGVEAGLTLRFSKAATG